MKQSSENTANCKNLPRTFNQRKRNMREKMTKKKKWKKNNNKKRVKIMLQININLRYKVQWEALPKGVIITARTNCHSVTIAFKSAIQQCTHKQAECETNTHTRTHERAHANTHTQTCTHNHICIIRIM